MEHLENKIIKKKVESIDFLPEEFERTIDSKFEVLLAATSNINNKRLNKRRFITLSLAACMLCFFWLNIEQTSTIKPIIHQKPMMKSVVSDQHLLSYDTSIKKLPLIDVEKRNKITYNNKGYTIKNNQTILKTDTISSLTQTVITPVVPTSIDSNETATLKPIQQKIKKHRFIEIDFENNSTPSNIVNSERPKKPSFYIQFNVKGNFVQNTMPRMNLSYKKAFQ